MWKFEHFLTTVKKIVISLVGTLNIVISILNTLVITFNTIIFCLVYYRQLFRD